MKDLKVFIKIWDYWYKDAFELRKNFDVYTLIEIQEKLWLVKKEV